MTIQLLHRQGMKISQIARKVGVSRTTVYEYLKRSPEEMLEWLASCRERRKKLDPYKEEMLFWLREHQDLSASQVLDWLQERYEGIDVAESTVRNYVSSLRERYHLPKMMARRQYEAIPDPPVGKQAQVDFGQTTQETTKGNRISLYFISFVLSHSRYKAVYWLDQPFTTRDVIWAHEEAFQAFGGIPKELVYDQDHLILVDENAGDCIFTAEFQAYLKEREFHVYMCRKSDPESKGRIENVVGFVKKNFAKHRVFSTIDKWNEQCQAWLVRTGNGKVHNTTKKRPVEVFQLEKKHLRPISKPTFEPSITRTVRKDNTICYAGNRYSVPLGTYRHGESNRVCLIAEDGRLKIIDGEGEIIADHVIDYGRGQLIQAKNHRRDRTKGIDAYMDSLSEHFSDAIEAVTYLSEIRNRYPRYIRDHLQLVSQAIQGKDRHILDRALAMCLDQQLYTGRDFRDVLTYLNEAQNAGDITPTEKDSAQIISPYACYQPETRDITGYIEILKGGVSHDGHSAS